MLYNLQPAMESPACEYRHDCAVSCPGACLYTAYCSSMCVHRVMDIYLNLLPTQSSTVQGGFRVFFFYYRSCVDIFWHEWQIQQKSTNAVSHFHRPPKNKEHFQRTLRESLRFLKYGQVRSLSVFVSKIQCISRGRILILLLLLYQ